MREKFFNATICLTTPLHIGTGKEQKPTDAPVRRQGDGKLIIPGRAIGGSLRTLATRLAPRLNISGWEKRICDILQPPDFEPAKPKDDHEADGAEPPCGCLVCQLFGDIRPVDGKTADSEVGSHASRLWVYDATAAAETAVYVRDGVGISRQTGAAVHNVKYEYEVVPTQTTFKLRLRLTYLGDDEALLSAMEQLLAATLAEWQAGRGQLGGNSARGLGSFELVDLKQHNTELKKSQDVVDYLLGTTKPAVNESWAENQLQGLTAVSGKNMRKKNIPAAGGFVKVKYQIHFTDLSLINDPLAALISGFDHAPLLTSLPQVGAVGRPALSGASLRGVLRSHGEKIARTLATNHVLPPQKDGKYSLETLKKAAQAFLSICPACYVYAGGEDDVLASCDTRNEEDQVEEVKEEQLCLSCRLFGSKQRGSRLFVRDAVLLAQELAGESWLAQDFLAIDRFTGGGLHGAKFDAAPLYQAQFAGELILHSPQDWELGWLLLLLRDMADGRLTAGFGKAKGYGHFKATNFVWEVGYLTPDDLPEPLRPLEDEVAVPSGTYLTTTHAPDGWLPATWSDAQQLVDAFNELIKSDEEERSWEPFKKDSFFPTERALNELGVAAAKQIEWYGVSRVEV